MSAIYPAHQIFGTLENARMVAVKQKKWKNI
jgi:hypothetical protein